MRLQNPSVLIWLSLKCKRIRVHYFPLSDFAQALTVKVDCWFLHAYVHTEDKSISLSHKGPL